MVNITTQFQNSSHMSSLETFYSKIIQNITYIEERFYLVTWHKAFHSLHSIISDISIMTFVQSSKFMICYFIHTFSGKIKCKNVTPLFPISTGFWPG